MRILKLLLSLIAFIVVSCSQGEDTSIVYGDRIEVKLGMNGDLNVSSDQETRASADNGIYGINVYFDKEKDGKTNDIYAFGVFDNVESMTITLLSGYKYRFACTFAKNGPHSLYYGQYDGNSYMGYAKPFQTNKHSSTQLGNKFVYSNSTGEYLSGITSGEAILISQSTGGPTTNAFPHPRINRYYGELDSYTPVTGGVATIPLKKTCFGLKLIIKGVPEGTLSANVKLSSDGDVLASYSTTTNDVIGGGSIYSFKDVYGCAMNNLNAAAAVVTWTYTSSKFSQWNLSGTNNITLKRNVLTTVTVSVTPDSASGSISVTEEEFGGENTINMGINTDGLIDIIVNPEPED